MPTPYITMKRDPRPWWAPWRRTVTLTCSEHGDFISGLVPLITESGLDVLVSASMIHFIDEHKEDRN